MSGAGGRRQRTAPDDPVVGELHRELRRRGRSYVHSGVAKKWVEVPDFRVGDALSALADQGVLVVERERNAADLYRVVE